MIKREVKRFILIIVLVSVFSLSNCRFMLSLSGPIPVEYGEKTLTLSWEDDHAGLAGTPSAISHFDIFYRDLGTPDWIFLQSTTDSQNIAIIQHSTVDDGDYEFAVQAVYNNEKKSEMHCSSDFSAWPTGGWYLKWRYN